VPHFATGPASRTSRCPTLRAPHGNACPCEGAGLNAVALVERNGDMTDMTPTRYSGYDMNFGVDVYNYSFISPYFWLYSHIIIILGVECGYKRDMTNRTYDLSLSLKIGATPQY